MKSYFCPMRDIKKMILKKNLTGELNPIAAVNRMLEVSGNGLL